MRTFPDGLYGQDSAMRKFLKIVISLMIFLVITGVGLGLYNDYDVQSRGNGPLYDPSVAVLRTPDTAFTSLTDFPYQPHYLEIEDADLGPLRVHYLDEGPADGEVVLMLHGQATWSYSFAKFIPILTAAGYRVIVPDLVGFGRSDKPSDWEAHTFQKHVDWLDATLNRLQIQNATAFVFDWGGYFALRLAAEQPELFSRLLLVTTTMPRADSVTGALWVAGWRRYIYSPEIFPISGMVNDMTGNGIDELTAKGLDAPYPDELHKGGPRRFPLMIPATPLHPANAPNQQAWEKLAGWDKPTIVLIAESMAQQGFKPQEFYDQLPGTKGQAHELYPDTNFFLIHDVPEQLAEKTVEFIEANPLPAGAEQTPPRAELGGQTPG